MPETAASERPIVFNVFKTEDDTRHYWVPVFLGKPDEFAADILAELGYMPDTDGWIEPATPSGWYDLASIGGMVYDLTRRGHVVLFNPVSADRMADPIPD